MLSRKSFSNGKKRYFNLNPESNVKVLIEFFRFLSQSNKTPGKGKRLKLALYSGPSELQCEKVAENWSRVPYLAKHKMCCSWVSKLIIAQIDGCL